MAATADGRRPSLSRRRSVSVSARPQSMRTTVPEASAARQLPPLPLASEAKRKARVLLQLLVQQREDALPGLGALRGALLVEHQDLGRVLLRGDLHAELLRLDLGIGPPGEEPSEEPFVLFLHLGFRI